MNNFSNLMQLANFPMAHGGPMMPYQGGMFPQAFGGPSNPGMQFMGGAAPGIGMSGLVGNGPLGGGMGGPMMPRQSPFGNGGYGGYGGGMNNLMMMNHLGRGVSGYGGY